MEEFVMVNKKDGFGPEVPSDLGFKLTNYYLEETSVTNTVRHNFSLLTNLVSCDIARPSVCLGLAIDISNSMCGEHRIDRLKKVIQSLIELLQEQDQLAIVVYHETASILLELCPMTLLNKTRAIDLIQDITCSKTTNLSQGLKLAIKSMEHTKVKGVIPNLVFMTDGFSNQGLTERDLLLGYSRNLVNKFNPDLIINILSFQPIEPSSRLAGIAEQFGGKYYYSPPETTHSRLLDYFLEISDLTKYLVGKNLTLTLEGHPEVQYNQLEKGDPLNILPGDLLVGSPMNILTNIKMADNGNHQLTLKLKLEYQDGENWDPDIDNVPESDRIYQILSRDITLTTDSKWAKHKSEEESQNSEIVIIHKYQQQVIELCQACLDQDIKKTRVIMLENAIRPLLVKNNPLVAKLAERLLKELYALRLKYKNLLSYSELRLVIPKNLSPAKNPTPIKRQRNISLR